MPEITYTQQTCHLELAYVCSECGGLVSDIGKHTDYHNGR